MPPIDELTRKQLPFKNRDPPGWKKFHVLSGNIVLWVVLLS